MILPQISKWLISTLKVNISISQSLSCSSGSCEISSKNSFCLFAIYSYLRLSTALDIFDFRFPVLYIIDRMWFIDLLLFFERLHLHSHEVFYIPKAHSFELIQHIVDRLVLVSHYFIFLLNLFLISLVSIHLWTKFSAFIFMDLMIEGKWPKLSH